MLESEQARALREQLARWTTAGLIDADQATRIEAAEAETAKTNVVRRRRLPLVVEALGYLGSVIALAAVAVAISQLWKHVPPGAELAFTVAAAVGLITVGAVLRTQAEPAFGRLRGVLWLIATASVASFAAVLTDSFLHLPGRDIAVLSAAAGLTCAIPLWWRNRSVLQHVAMFAAAAALIGACINWIVPSVHAWQFGLAFWTLSVLWGAVAYRGLLVPSTTGLAASCTGLLVGAFLTMDIPAGYALAMVTVVGLLSAGVALHRVLLMGFGAVGTLFVVPATAGRYLGGSVSAPVAVAAVGLVLLGLALWLARTRGRA